MNLEKLVTIPLGADLKNSLDFANTKLDRLNTNIEGILPSLQSIKGLPET